MASSFWSPNFYFNGVHSSNFNVCIVDFNDNSIVKQLLLGMSISLNREVSLGKNSFYSEGERECENLTMQLTKTDGSQWTTSDFININRWLFTRNFCKFQTEDFQDSSLNVVYYLKAVSMKKFINNNYYGYIEVEFASYEPYAYISPSTAFVLTNNVGKVLYNYSNLYTNYKPKLKITNLGGASEVISIKNNSTDKEALTITGMNFHEVVIVDCLMGTVSNISGENRFSVLQNYNFIELIGGNNNLISTGNAQVEVICEFPIII